MEPVNLNRPQYNSLLHGARISAENITMEKNMVAVRSRETTTRTTITTSLYSSAVPPGRRGAPGQLRRLPHGRKLPQNRIRGQKPQ